MHYIKTLDCVFDSCANAVMTPPFAVDLQDCRHDHLESGMGREDSAKASTCSHVGHQRMAHNAKIVTVHQHDKIDAVDELRQLQNIGRISADRAKNLQDRQKIGAGQNEGPAVYHSGGRGSRALSCNLWNEVR